jgi:hypothetical protein
MGNNRRHIFAVSTLSLVLIRKCYARLKNLAVVGQGHNIHGVSVADLIVSPIDIVC